MARRSGRGVYRFLKSFSVVIGVVLVWRGLWHLLDWVDVAWFEGDIRWTALGGILIGLFVLYLPDGDIKELDKL